ncbi:Pentatricopeptide repeat [Dillenia turbinata]|uniref:Pentatricopeptide repeat n=1 Tax=Dillenia turbinata TaxID=194707 RepID=A0AAN8Z9I6_9MAGN
MSVFQLGQRLQSTCHLSLRLFKTHLPLVLSRSLHTHVSEFQPDLKPLNSKISYFMRNGLLEEAQKLFDEMPQRNTVTWNAMIRGYFQNGHFDKAVTMFNQMPECDVVTYNTVIAGLVQKVDIDGARKVFDKMLHRDVVTWNSMLSGYVHNGFMEEAMWVFDRMPLKDVISWNLVLWGHVNSGSVDLAEKVFWGMSDPDVASWTIMLSGLVNAGRIVEARALFDDMPVKDIRAWKTIIGGYVENGEVLIAESLFWKMPEHDLDSWRSLVTGLARVGRVNDAMRLYMLMPQKCRLTWNSLCLELIRNGLVEESHALIEQCSFGDIVAFTNVIVGYFGLGEVENAVKLFELIATRDATMWNVVIFGLGENDYGEEGLKFFNRMKEEGPSPDEATFTSIMTICADLPTLHLGKQAHAQVIKTGFDYFVKVSNAVVTMYERCGNLDSALLAFSSMPNQDIVSWNAIICGFTHHGNGEKALEMFRKMRLTNIQPNHVTFVGVLSACSHAGFVDQGKQCFDFMRYKCFLQPTAEHYTTMIDLLGRSGLIDEAMSFLGQMREDRIEAPASIWGALIGACRIHNNIEVAELAGERLLEVDPYNTGVYMILAEMYLNSGRRDNAERILVRMKEQGAKKQPGCSWIEVNNCGHVFLAGDTSHPDFSSVHNVLDLMQMEMETGFLETDDISFQDFRVALEWAIVHSIEIDPLVISASIEAMGFLSSLVVKPSGKRAISKPKLVDEILRKGIYERLFLCKADAEEFILDTTNTYDSIFIDAYDGDDIFPHKLRNPSGPFLKNLNSDILNLDGSTPTVFQQILPMGKYVSGVYRAFKDELVGNGTRGHRDNYQGLGFTVSVPWVWNTSIVVCRGFELSG